MQNYQTKEITIGHINKMRNRLTNLNEDIKDLQTKYNNYPIDKIGVELENMKKKYNKNVDKYRRINFLYLIGNS